MFNSHTRRDVLRWRGSPERRRKLSTEVWQGEKFTVKGRNVTSCQSKAGFMLITLAWTKKNQRRISLVDCHSTTATLKLIQVSFLVPFLKQNDNVDLNLKLQICPPTQKETITELGVHC